MEKKPITLGIALLAIMLAGSGSLAYFTSEKRTHNIITSGGIDIEVIQKVENNDGKLVTVPEITGELMPGVSINGSVHVENQGKSQAWIRLKADVAIEDQEGNLLPETISKNIPVVSFAHDKDWKEGKDGFWYYQQPVDPKEETNSLFESLNMNPKVGNDYQNSVVNLNVHAQAVQTANNGKSAEEAIGWPLVEEEAK